jgi:pyruvate/2-oxoglutarate dehydrogenase complex dihydrolipoamide dehydrogenase (E3) component
MEIHPTDKPKRVMVVGGGPGGLDVAWISAIRGHEVHLYEREAVLGGQLNLATVADYKKELLNLISFQKRQIEKSDVRIHLNHEVTLDTISEESPDVVIFATGSVPLLPPMPGIEKPNILTPTEIFNGRRPEKRKTIVVGGGPTGCEVAQHLSANGCLVTIVELLPKIAGQLEPITRKVLLGKLKANNVQLMTEKKVSRIEEDGVFVIGTDEKELFLEAETVVMAVGNKPVNSLYEKIKAKGITSYQIGDCLEPRSAKAAIYEGAVIGRTI